LHRLEFIMLASYSLNGNIDGNSLSDDSRSVRRGTNAVRDIIRHESAMRPSREASALESSP
jgi:hypothetical protein